MSAKVACVLLVSVCVVRTQVIPGKSRTNDGDYNTVNTDGSFDFGYTNKDVGSSYHLAHGNANKVVGGRFGARDPATGTVKETVYTAGPRGFRAKGPNIHRKMDLDQRPRGPIGNKDDPYFDPNEDPSYDFKFNTRTYSKTENADARGDVKGHYSYVDDIGERHDVTYIAGRDTGFHVSSAHPDSPNVIGSPFHRAPLVRGETKQRGRTAVQRGLDGSYRFISAGPDQRRTESSDANGNVRGSYTFLDDKGVQRTVHYIAGPGIGYRIVKNGKDPFIPAYFPTIPSAYDPDFVNAAVPASFSPDDTGSDDIFKSRRPIRPGRPTAKPYGPTKKPYVPNKPFQRPSSDAVGGGYPKPSSGGGPSRPSTSYGGSQRPSSSSGGSSQKPSISGGSFQRPSSSGGNFQRPSTSEGGNFPILPPGDLGGTFPKPSPSDLGGTFHKPASAVPGGSSYEEIVPPSYDSGGSSYNSGSSSYEDKGPESGPDYAIGFNIHHTDDHSNSKPGSTTIIHTKPGTTIIHKPGTTIIRNIGEDYFGIPPGTSVRAHVQSIDLYPFDSKPISPSEALEKDKT